MHQEYILHSKVWRDLRVVKFWWPDKDTNLPKIMIVICKQSYDKIEAPARSDGPTHVSIPNNKIYDLLLHFEDYIVAIMGSPSWSNYALQDFIHSWSNAVIIG